MSDRMFTPGIAAGRLDPDALRGNFTDLHPALDDHEALVAADRCYFCHDAPCITACPTSIDIPLFIRPLALMDPRHAAASGQAKRSGMVSRRQAALARDAPRRGHA